MTIKDLRRYLKAFAGASHPNAKPICPRQLMILPRIIKG